MAASQSVRQSAPNRLEVRSGGGCLSLFGIPFLAAGIFLVLVALQIVPVSNAEEVPLWSWSVILLMGLVFIAFSTGLVFGRTRVIIDRNAGSVVKQWRLLVPVKQEERSLLDYRMVTLNFSVGDSESSNRYTVTLEGQPGPLPLFSELEYGAALAQAGSVARLLDLPLVDATSDHEATIAPDRVEESLWEQLAVGDQGVLKEIEPPPGLQSQVQLAGATVRIRIPVPALTRVGLLGYAFPLAILLVLGPTLLRFFRSTETPTGIQICVAALALFFFAGLPLLELMNALVRSRRGATILTASPAGISLEQRGAWRSRTTTIPAAEILGLDYSTSESSLRSAERAAAQQLAARKAAPTASDPKAAPAGSSLTRSRWLGRAVRGQGVVIKTRQGFTKFAAGLPDQEILYLWTLVRRALAGSRQ